MNTDSKRSKTSKTETFVFDYEKVFFHEIYSRNFASTRTLRENTEIRQIFNKINQEVRAGNPDEAQRLHDKLMFLLCEVETRENTSEGIEPCLQNTFDQMDREHEEAEQKFREELEQRLPSIAKRCAEIKQMLDDQILAKATTVIESRPPQANTIADSGKEE